MHGVGSRLSARGHRVRLVTGQPAGVTSHRDVDGIDVRYVRTPHPGWLAGRGWTREAAFAFPAAAAAAVSRADVVLSYYFSDAAAATVVRRRRPVVLKLTGAVPRDRVTDEPVDRRLLGRALDTAAEVWVNSAYVAEVMSGWGRDMHVVPAGVDVTVFRPCAPRAAEPLVVCTAATGEPRKRLVDLVDAWPAVVDAVPEARLLLVQRHDPRARAALLDRLPRSVHATVSFDGPYDDIALAETYSRAWVTVAPAVHEALGLATLESLACGTAVVGADSGATSALLADPACGRLYEPLAPAACAEAIVAVLGAPEAVRPRRALAERYSWPRIVDDVESRLLRFAR